jgi:hypothetical protein
MYDNEGNDESYQEKKHNKHQSKAEITENKSKKKQEKQYV